jgi:hypothetical protein
MMPVIDRSSGGSYFRHLLRFERFFPCARAEKRSHIDVVTSRSFVRALNAICALLHSPKSSLQLLSLQNPESLNIMRTLALSSVSRIELF